MLEYREFTGLANDEIGPLDNDNGDKEGSVAGVFKDFTVPEKKIKYPLKPFQNKKGQKNLRYPTKSSLFP